MSARTAVATAPPAATTTVLTTRRGRRRDAEKGKQQNDEEGRPHRIYPAYYFRASPTYFRWVRLTAADVHALREEPNFKDQNVLFHLNHPIRFVRLAGVVTATDDFPPRFALLTLDDGSGATIELKIERAAAPPPQDPTAPNGADASTGKAAAAATPTETVVPGLTVTSYPSFALRLSSARVDVGTVLAAKGTLSSFRGVRQLELRRARVLATTREEVAEWREMGEFRREVLGRPWALSREERERVKREVGRERREREAEGRRRAEREGRERDRAERRAERRRQREERHEKRAERKARELNQGALI